MMCVDTGGKGVVHMTFNLTDKTQIWCACGNFVTAVKMEDD